MKNLYGIISVAMASGALMFSGCAKESINNEKVAVGETRNVTISATTSDMVESKAGHIDGKGMHWHEGDKISFFARSGATGNAAVHDNLEFRVSCNTYPAKTANFVGSWEESETEPTYFVGYYPYNENVGMDGVKLTNLTYPAVQYYEVDEEGNPFVRNLPMIARGAVTVEDGVPTLTDGTLRFYPLTAMFKIPIKLDASVTGNVKVKKVTLLTNGGSDYLSGTISSYDVSAVTYGAKPTAYPTSWIAADRSKVVTLDCGEGVDISAEEETVFLIGVPRPQSASGYSGGFKMVVETDAGISVVFTKTSYIVANPGNLYKIETLEITPVVAPEINIPDPALRAVLVEKCLILDLEDGEGNVKLIDRKIPGVAGALDLSAATGIENLAGIENFTNLKTLTVKGLAVSSLDIVKSLTELVTLNAQNLPNLKRLDVSGHKTLATVDANQGTVGVLEYLDISNCPDLAKVIVSANTNHTLMSNKTTMTFTYINNATYRPTLKTIKAEGLGLTKITAMNNITVPEISFKDCTKLATVNFSQTQTTPITIDVTDTAMTSAGITGNATIKGEEAKITFIGLP